MVKKLIVRNRNIVSLLGGLLAVTVVIILFKNQTILSNPQVQTKEVLQDENFPQQPTPTPYETVENGVYTNYKYGFKFEYPEDIFVNYRNIIPSTRNATMNLEAEFDDAIENPEYWADNYNMTIGTHKNTDLEGFYKEYSRRINVPKYQGEEEKSQTWNEVTVKKVEIDGNPGYITYSYPTPYASDYEPTHSHSLNLLIKNETYLFINITSPVHNDTLKDERLNILYSIINSLEFFEPRTL